jgi:hypothetical protein
MSKKPRDNSTHINSDTFGFSVNRADYTTLLTVTRMASSNKKDNTAWSCIRVGNAAGCYEITGTTRTINVKRIR